MDRIRLRYLIIVGITLLLLSACKKKIPVVTTLAVTGITQSTANSGGNVVDEGDAPVVSRGIVWGIDIPTLSSYAGMSSEGTGTGIFESIMTGLEQKTTYMTRAFASNKYGTSYGQIQSFTTMAGKVILTTEWPTEITASNAKLNGNISYDGGANVTERGFYIGVSANPETSGSRLPAGSGSGSFSVTVTTLSVNTTYYFRAYAINSSGESLGSVIYFSTNMTVAVNKVFNNSVTYGSLTDFDGNIYKTIQIGNQIWMAEDLKVTHFNEGNAIPIVTDNLTWGSLTTPAYCWYNNDIAYRQNFGALYNWFAVATNKLCPSGWHIPSDNEWSILTDYLGGTDVSGGKLKETGLYHWNSPNLGASNSSGFTSLPSGGRLYPQGTFQGIGVYDSWWTSTEYNSSKPYYRSVASFNEMVYCGKGTLKGAGVTVRCIKD